MNKQLTVRRASAPPQLYRAAGIEVAAFFIVGYPGETVASIEETFRLALTLPLDEISFNVPDAAAGLRPLRAARRPRTRAGLDEGERGHLRLPLRDRRALAAAPDRRDHGGVRARRSRRPARAAASPPAPAPRPTSAAGRARPSGSSNSPRAGGAIAQPPPHLELGAALEDREAHLGGREVAVEGEHLVRAAGSLAAASRA